jgi:hypothetical protein
MKKGEESDRELESREQNEREIALMIVDALWHSKWIRLALQDYEYHGKGFGGVRQMFGKNPPDSERPSMPAIKSKLERLVLAELNERQCEIYTHEKKNKRTVTAVDLFKPNRRMMNTYGLNVNEVSLTRGAWKVFERNAKGDVEYEAYCRENGVHPKDVIELDSV